jgi:hypothetical protein
MSVTYELFFQILNTAIWIAIAIIIYSIYRFIKKYIENKTSIHNRISNLENKVNDLENRWYTIGKYFT